MTSFTSQKNSKLQSPPSRPMPERLPFRPGRLAGGALRRRHRASSGRAPFEARAVPPVSLASSAVRRTTMATYIVLASFTEQGIRNVKDTTKRADAVKQMGEKL